MQKKLPNFQNYKYLLLQLLSKKFAKAKSAGNVINYTFLKSPTHGESRHAQIFVNFAKLDQSASFCSRFPKSDKNSKSNCRK